MKNYLAPILAVIGLLILTVIFIYALEQEEKAPFKVCAREFGSATKEYALCVWEKTYGQKP